MTAPASQHVLQRSSKKDIADGMLWLFIDVISVYHYTGHRPTIGGQPYSSRVGQLMVHQHDIDNKHLSYIDRVKFCFHVDRNSVSMLWGVLFSPRSEAWTNPCQTIYDFISP